jgi:hypothetical protein
MVMIIQKCGVSQNTRKTVGKKHFSNSFFFSNQQIRSNSVIVTAAICSLDANDNLGSVNFTTGGGPVAAIASEAHQTFLEYWHKNEGLQVPDIPLQFC